MKMLHLKNIETALQKLINIDLPIKIAYKLTLIIADVDKYLSTFNQFQVDFINKHGERLGDEQVKISTEKIKEFDEGINELLDEEIDLQPVEVPLSLIIDSEIKLTALELNALKNAGFLIDDINTSED
jgi:hypothetical protein